MTTPPFSRRAFLGAAALGTGGVLLAGPARAQLELDITRGFVEPMPIAISPLAGDDPQARQLGESIAQVVSADLESSGLFRTIDRRAYIQSAEEMREVPRFADWRQVNAQALVTGLVRGNGPAVTVEFRLWDIFGGNQLTGLRLDAAASQWRRLAHKIADAVYQRLTGESGYFDTKIAYVNESGPATKRIKRVALMDQDGANHAFLTDGRDLVLTPRFSPDARQVAYMAYRGRQPRIFLRDIASGRDSVLADFAGMTFSPRFAPDGRTLLLTMANAGNSDIYAYEIASRRSRRLTDSAAIDTSPSFSPDGRRIVFNSDRGGNPHLYVMNAGGGAAQRISFGSGRYGSPEWSPRGDLIAFTKMQGGQFATGIMRPDGSDERLLSRSFEEEGPTWSPNGRVVMFYRKSGPRVRLFTVDITGYNEREVPTPQDASDPDWSPLLP